MSKSYMNDNYNRSHMTNSMQYNMGSSTSAFPSKQLHQKFEWKQLMKLNPNYIQSSGDIGSLEPYIGNLLSSSITEEELQVLPEGYVVNLIKLLQLVGESLINIQQKLECDNKALEDQAMKMSQSGPQNSNKSQDYIRVIKKLKQEIKEKDILIQTYQKIVQNDKGMHSAGRGLNFNHDGYNDNDSQIDDNENKRYFCQFCSGKKYSSELILEDHMRRRHLMYSDFIPSKTKGGGIDMKLIELKNHFDTLIRNNQMQNEYQRLNDKLNIIENAITGNNADMLSTYNMNLMNQSRTMNQPQQSNSQRPSVIQPLSSKTYVVNPNTTNEASFMLKDTMNKINDKIERNNKENNDRFQKLFKEMSKMKMSVTKDLSNIKMQESYNRPDNRSNTAQSHIQFDHSQNVVLTKPKDVTTIIVNNDENDNKVENISSDQLKQKMYVNVSDNNATPQPQDNNTNISKITLPQVQQENASTLSIITQKRNEANQHPVKDSKIKTKIDIELDEFFQKFTERDNKLQHGTIKTYTTELVQPDFERNKNISKVIDSYIQKTMFAMAGNQTIKLNTLNKDDLMQLINNCCQDLSEKGMEVGQNNVSTYYGYYKQSIDFLLQLEQTIDDGNNIFIQSKEDEKRAQEIKRFQASILNPNRSNISQLGIRLDQEKGNDEGNLRESPRFNQSFNVLRSDIDRPANSSEAIDQEL